jgi:hypothetical protein
LTLPKHDKSEHVSVKKQVCQIEVYADTLQDTERRDLKGSSLKGRKKQTGRIPFLHIYWNKLYSFVAKFLEGVYHRLFRSLNGKGG